VFTFLRLLVNNSGALAMFFSAPRVHFALAYYWKSGAKHLRYFLALWEFPEIPQDVVVLERG